MVRDAKVDVVLQRIEENIGSELNVIPQKIRRYGVNNIFQRAFSYLLGWRSDGKPVKLSATASGALKIASVGAGLEHIEFHSGIATSEWSAPIIFSHQISRLDVITIDYPMWLAISVDNMIFEEKIRCLPNIRNIFDFSIKAVKVKTAYVNEVEYELVGEW